MRRLICDRILLLLRQWCQRFSDPLLVGIMDGHQNLEGRIAGLIHPKRQPVVRVNRWGVVGLTALLLGAGLLVGGIRLGADPPKPAGGGAPQGEPPADPSKVYVEGVVVDEAGKPVPGIQVSVGYFPKPLETTTAADGSFRFGLDAQRAWNQKVWVVASSGDGRRKGLGATTKVGPQDDVVRCRVVLKPSRTLTVRVQDAQGNAVAGAAVGGMGSDIQVPPRRLTPAAQPCSFCPPTWPFGKSSP